MRHLNHGKHFWALVKSYIPDYERRDAVIKALGSKLL
ncbi:MAG: YgjP-like metallopeptidase domain-containing protein [Candidatus Sericytochromatia bacterium]